MLASERHGAPENLMGPGRHAHPWGQPLGSESPGGGYYLSGVALGSMAKAYDLKRWTKFEVLEKFVALTNLVQTTPRLRALIIDYLIKLSSDSNARKS